MNQVDGSGIEQIDSSGNQIDQEDNALANQVGDVTKVIQTMSNKVVNESAAACDAYNKFSNCVSSGSKDAGDEVNDEIKTVEKQKN